LLLERAMTLMALGLEKGRGVMGRLNKQLDPSQTGYEAERLEIDLHKKIVGQDEAIQQIINIYQTNLAGMSSPGRPIGNFLFRDRRDRGKPGWWRPPPRAWWAMRAP
jgi:hypothetical protein